MTMPPSVEPATRRSVNPVGCALGVLALIAAWLLLVGCFALLLVAAR